MRLRRVQGFALRLCLLPFDLEVSYNLKSPKLCHAELRDRSKHEWRNPEHEDKLNNLFILL